MKRNLLVFVRVILSYLFLVAGIYAGVSFFVGEWARGLIISAVWLTLSAIDEVIFWWLVRRYNE